jgi:hypothetical protein
MVVLPAPYRFDDLARPSKEFTVGVVREFDWPCANAARAVCRLTVIRGPSDVASPSTQPVFRKVSARPVDLRLSLVYETCMGRVGRDAFQQAALPHFFFASCGASLDTSTCCLPLLNKMQQSNIRGEHIAGDTRYSSSYSVVIQYSSPLQEEASHSSSHHSLSAAFPARTAAAAAISTSTTQTAARKRTTADDEVN